MKKFRPSDFGTLSADSLEALYEQKYGRLRQPSGWKAIAVIFLTPAVVVLAAVVLPYLN